MNQSKMKKLLLTCLMAIVFVITATGCGAKTPEELLATMQEFSSPDGTITMSMNKDWITSDAGMENWLLVSNKNESNVYMVMQFPKMMSDIDSVDDLKEEIMSLYTATNNSVVEAPVVPGLTNVVAETCSMKLEDVTGQGYLVFGESDYAFYTILGVANKMNDKFKNSFEVSLSTFKETAPEIENNATVEATDTIQWINGTYAVLTHLNGWDYTMYGGLALNDESAAISQASLQDWWSVTDRDTAVENLNWILEEGHRTEFAGLMQQLQDEGITEVAPEEYEAYLQSDYGLTADEAKLYATMYGYFEEFGPDAIAGWDYSRAMSLLGSYYLAGYYTEQEALDQALEIAATIQPLFTSWDEFMASYMRGYEYWAEESSDERMAVYEELKGFEDSPYKLDWNMTLEKNW